MESQWGGLDVQGYGSQSVTGGHHARIQGACWRISKKRWTQHEAGVRATIAQGRPSETCSRTQLALSVGRATVVLGHVTSIGEDACSLRRSRSPALAINAARSTHQFADSLRPP